MSRSTRARLSTATLLTAMFDAQIAEHEQTGAHAGRIDGLREGQAKWAQRVTDLKAQLDTEENHQ